jgi:hypothetical protein
VTEERKVALTSDPAPQTDEVSFLRRWSDRKTLVKEPTAPPTLEPVADSPVTELTDADMPPLEALDEKSDYSGFFSPKVSEALRRQALRKLFHTPAFNITDGLNDYDEDYTSFATLGSVVTQEMRHRMEVEAKRMAESMRDKAVPAAAGQESVAVTAATDETTMGELESETEQEALSITEGESEPNEQSGGDRTEYRS